MSSTPEPQQQSSQDPAAGVPQQPAGGPSSQQGTGLEGLDPKIGGLLSYLLFGWIGGLLMYFTQKHPEVRFHAAQSVIFSIALFVLYVGLGIVSSILSIGVGAFGVWALFSLLYSLIGLASFVLWVFLCIKGYALDHFKLPVIGDIAEQWAAK